MTTKERPILFSAPMVRALLDGNKTQTRRAVKRIIKTELGDCIKDIDGLPSRLDIAPMNWEVCPHGQPGDRLWVRETWAYHVQAIGAVCDEDGPFVYAADAFGKHDRLCEKWTPSIHMPRWASRLLLEITAVRVERLQDISEADAVAEGITCNHNTGIGEYDGCWASPQDHYRELWETINGPGSWDANPWVWVIEFKRINGAT